MATLSDPKPDSDLRARIVRVALPFIARGGVRGATLREIAADCGTTPASLLSIFGNKDGLIAACFDEAIRSDIARLEDLAAECLKIGTAPGIVPAFLWTLCDEAGGARRTEMLTLIEMLLSAAVSPQIATPCRQWLLARRDMLRAIARAHAIDELAIDILGLHLISESSFAVSCAATASYAILARSGFLEAAARLTDTDTGGIPPDMARLADAFFADPASDRADSDEALGRGAESRAKIIDAAASIIEVEGLAAVTNRAVADRAGVSLALTTYHFKSVADLAFAGILRVFEKVNAGLRRAGARGASQDEAVGRIRSRAQLTGVERLRSRGMAEISLAAARGIAQPSLGLAMRRQRGTITHASLGDTHGHVTRTRAASHALWSSGAFLVAAALSDADALYDFESQAAFASERLLGLR